MKKIAFITIIALTAMIASCQKEKMNPAAVQANPSEAIKFEQAFSNSKTITVRDQSGKYSIELLIQCNDKNSFDNEIARMESTELELSSTRKNRKTVSSADKSLLNTQTKTLSLAVKENAIYTTLKNVNIGDAKGFAFNSKNTTERGTQRELVQVQPVRFFNFPSSLLVLYLEFVAGPSVDVNTYITYNSGASYTHTYMTNMNSVNYFQNLSAVTGGSGSPSILALSLAGSNPAGASALMIMEFEVIQ